MFTILIAAPEHLEALKERDEFSDAQVFSDTEALRALEVITRKRPDVVALERQFAATTRGAALINRIKADPKLVSCEIRIVAHDSPHTRATDTPTEAGGEDGTAVAIAVPVAAPVEAPLDQRGTRRAPRFKLIDGVEMTVDGNVATVIDLSVVGAQVVSPTILKPNQRVRLVIGGGKKPIRVSAGVAWASFELVKASPRYRAGIDFFDADPEPLHKFCEAKKRP